MKTLRKILLAVIAVALILTVLFGILFVRLPVISDTVDIDGKDLAGAAGCAYNISRAVYKNRQDEIITCTLKANEKAALIKTLLISAKASVKKDVLPFEFYPQGRNIVVKVEKPIGVGLVIPVEIILEAGISGGRINTDIKSINAGMVPLPQVILNEISRVVSAELNRDPAAVQAAQIIVSAVNHDNGSLTLQIVRKDAQKIVKRLLSAGR